MKPLHSALAAAFAVLLGLWVQAFVPPMQSPDEAVHLARAYLLSQGQWALESPLDAPAVMVDALGRYVSPTPGYRPMSGGEIDPGWLAFLLHHLLTPQTPAPDWHWGEGPAVYAEMPGVGYYLPLAYAPHAAALALTQALGLSVASSFDLLRLLLLGTNVAVLWLAWSLWPPSPGVAALLLLPMTVYQFVNPTLDGFTTACLVLALSLAARFWPPGKEPPRGWQVMALLLAVAAVAGSRLHMLPLLVLPLALAWRMRSVTLALAALVLGAMVLGWIGWSLADTVDRRVPRPLSSTAYLAHFVTRPAEVASLIAATVGDLRTLSFYAASFVGTFGILLLPMPMTAYVLCSLACLTALAASVGGADGTPGTGTWRALLMLLAALSMLLILIAMLVSSTRMPATRIEGVQGRYFLMPALLVVYAFVGLRPVVAARAGWAAVAMLALASATWIPLVLQAGSR